MKKNLLILMMFVTAVTNLRAIPGHGPDFEEDGIYYYIDENDPSSVFVTYKFDATSVAHYSYAGDVIIPEQVEKNGTTYTVKGIAPGAFASCLVTSVTLPNSIISIGFQAFAKCQQLTALNLPDGLTSVGYGAFQASSIEKLNFPNGITTLPEDVCRESKLKEVSFPEHLKSIGQYAFYKTCLEHVILPNELETMGELTFYGTTTLTDVVIPNTLTSVPRYCFNGCTSLATVSFLPTSCVATICENAFSGCTALTMLNVPSSVVTIESSAFASCGIAKLTFQTGSMLKTIGQNAFASNPLFETVTIPASVESIAYRAFRFCKATDAGYPMTFEEGSRLTEIGSEAFAESKLKSIVLPASLRTIGSNAFYYCTSLETCTMQEGVETIGDGAFFVCSSLTELTIPSTVTSIGNQAFWNTSKLTIELRTSTEDVGQAAFKHVKQVDVTNTDAWMRMMAKGIPFHNGTNVNYWGSSTVVYHNGSILTDYVIPEGVDTIVAGGFYQVKEMESVKFPNSLKYIGQEAFLRCTALKKVVFGNSIMEVCEDAFKSCSAVESCDIGDLKNWCEAWLWGVNSNPLSVVGKVMLNGTELQELVIPANTKRIGNFSFYNCRRFSEVTIPTSVTCIGKYAFYNCTDLETVTFKTTSEVDSIDIYAFCGTALQSINLPASVSTIEEFAFYDCKQLTSISIPTKVKSIKKSTFQGCTSLATATLPCTLENIGEKAFYGTALKRIDVPTALKSIGTSAFYGCSIDIHLTNLAQWYDITFGSGWSSKNYIYVNGEMLAELTVPGCVTGIGDYAFNLNHGLQALTIEEGVKTIGTRSFFECPNLSTVILPASIENTGSEAIAVLTYEHGKDVKHDVNFYIADLRAFIESKLAENIKNTLYNGYNTNLYLNNVLQEDLTVPEGITSLGAVFNAFSFKTVTLPTTLNAFTGFAFSNETSLDYVYCKSKFAPELNWTGSAGTIFPSTVKAIYVPKGRSNNYKNNWTNRASIIKEADMEMTGSQSAASIAEMKKAYTAVTGAAATYMDLTEATLDESVTTETLKAGDENANIIYYLPDASTISGDNIVKDGVAESVVLTDGGGDICVPKEFTAVNLTNTRSLSQSDANAYTLCLPYDYTLPEGLKAYTMNSTDGEGNIVFKQVERIEANKPYLVVCSTTADNLNAGNVTVAATPDEMDDAGTDGFKFCGTLATISNANAAAMGAYILQKNKTWRPVSTENPSAIIGAGRAYIVLQTAGSRPAIASVINDETTAVDILRLRDSDGTETWYSLSGQRLDRKPTKAGIYMNGGKKVVVNP